MEHLDKLMAAYNSAPAEYQTTRYWEKYHQLLVNEIKKADLTQFRNGSYPLFGTFGFTETIYHYHHSVPKYKKWLLSLIRKLFITNRSILPYSININNIRDIAYRNCLFLGELNNAVSIENLEVCTYGKPNDLFTINGKAYTMQFLGFYIRYCFAQKHIKFSGNEILIELGSGSGHQVEILKKAYPNLTVLCFDLPAPLYLCEHYLTQALGAANIVSSEKTLEMKNLDNLEKGKVYMFSSWQFPLLKNFKADVFWNAASFGEMEPEIVKNYLSSVLGNVNWIYLLQAQKGKESHNTSGVVKPTTFYDYDNMLKGYTLKETHDAYQAHRRMAETGGYFEAIWQKE
ncbi:MAG: putative sugar O-methyltransferase [Sphingobacteriales bacterium]|jgi:putative sugar O-methyltransferase|nr:putative sugar O-methyltransferase [Sphingobacteriales bacterium]MBP9140185.1 putative sugar O-methyltransferase [Chitinophagales bacterium]MDA0197681.1 putative sugar O-methyltransferase [Bacteroidota bacterium]MBK6888960.1 putative sugar O-methyltransferase [Sphingobacteriales bacterium]MBK7528538.1 putative sugar O-methyltransferase [Sphingobacteriales bacterium]